MSAFERTYRIVTLVSPKQEINDKLQDSVATYLMCDGVVIVQQICEKSWIFG